ncbi:peptidase D [Coccidioides immitis RS]|uniref:Xaa-Pro aminopeptidase n=3 Tax=Coccidioides immitis TaxID=5501 RepID=J3KB07_COCIM|nr:peptidase D [Coccidioides immitis RS]EAS32258.3 peptidase D [Coccidioides immitis RS]KMP07472.1 xaa-Pro dipeptidase [Coccidioides immitis RMSCC 2394]KMU72078.1 xaa-Pro aminopeptidase I [Coccidioides immitis RMSCC 3703]TPX19412.1 hypothetical protein DIZ76_017201 [Coccidioides immitis]
MAGSNTLSSSEHGNDPRGHSYSIHIQTRGTTLDKYPAKQHARNVARQLGLTDGLIYLMSQSTRTLEDSDQPQPFRQRRYFFYLSGVDEPDCHLTFDIKSDILTLYVPHYDLRKAIWVGPTLRPSEALMRYDLNAAKTYDELSKDIRTWASKSMSPVIYILHEGQKPNINAHFLAFNHEDLLPAMDACREIKDEHEIDLIRRANEISASAHIEVLLGIRNMQNEAEIHGKFLDTCVSQGARNQSYEIIAASGENAAILHYTKNNEPLDGRQLVCLDAGAEWNCYASDVTRTFPRRPYWPSCESANIYSVVQRMQEECINGLKEGVRYLDLHILAHRIAIEELLSLGILKGGSTEEILQSGASLVFFPHGLGHHVGLEVHDVSPTPLMAFSLDKYKGLPLLSCRPPCTLSAPYLKAGMVVTVEPGIYFSRPALKDARRKPLSKYIDMDVVQKYIPVGGVRIEDDILVTRDGFENLTKAPKGREMLKTIR